MNECKERGKVIVLKYVYVYIGECKRKEQKRSIYFKLQVRSKIKTKKNNQKKKSRRFLGKHESQFK